MNRRKFTTTAALSTLSAFTIANAPQATNRKKIKPKRLKKGDTLALITPGSFISDESLQKAVVNAENLGFKVALSKNIRSKRGFTAGTDAERLADLHWAFQDTKINGVWCARGGYGCGRILQNIDYQIIKKNPKALIGYSDITALLNAITCKTGLITFHGPVGASEFPEFTHNHFQNTLMFPNTIQKLALAVANAEQEDSIYHSFSIRSGKAKGELVGGNLSLLAAMVGTPFQPVFKNKIVFIEDVGERPYRIDRMLTQLRQGTDLQQAAGIALGIFADCEAKEGSDSLTLKQTLTDRLADLGMPVAYGLSFGHIDHQITLPIGIAASFDADQFSLTLNEAAVE